MLDDAEEDDHQGVCRDESCTVTYVHPSHVWPLIEAKGGRPRPPWWELTEPEGYKRPDSRGLHEAVKRAFSATDWPLAFVDIKNTVRNDYGSVSQRSLHRHISRLIEEGFIKKLDLQLAYSAYIRSDSKFLIDLDNVRDHLLGKYARELTRPGKSPKAAEFIAAATAVAG